MSVIRTWFPAPLLSTSLLCVWLLLARTVNPGQLPHSWELPFDPACRVEAALQRVRVRRPDVIVRYVLRGMGDVILSNLTVGLRFSLAITQPDRAS